MKIVEIDETDFDFWPYVTDGDKADRALIKVREMTPCMSFSTAA